MSANVFKMSLDQIVGPNGNKEFTDLIKIMGCNVGRMFDLNKLIFDKIIISSDADVDGLFIRSLLLAFYFKLFPEIIRDGRLFIAEPPLYRVDDKKNPFVINKEDYIDRYVKAASKDYKIGYRHNMYDILIDYLSKDRWTAFLSATSSYVQDITNLVDHYKVNGRLLEVIFEYIAQSVITPGITITPEVILSRINIQQLMNKIGQEFKEIYFDDERALIVGSIEAKQQSVELNDGLIRRSLPLIKIIQEWGAPINGCIVLKDNKTNAETNLSLLGALKILKKYQPDILHRFKGLGENDDEDIKTTIMDPNTRMLIRVNIDDVENETKIFQILRGGTQTDALNRKLMMSQYKISKDLIDT